MTEMNKKSEPKIQASCPPPAPTGQMPRNEASCNLERPSETPGAPPKTASERALEEALASVAEAQSSIAHLAERTWRLPPTLRHRALQRCRLVFDELTPIFDDFRVALSVEIERGRRAAARTTCVTTFSLTEAAELGKALKSGDVVVVAGDSLEDVEATVAQIRARYADDEVRRAADDAARLMVHVFEVELQQPIGHA
jgi:hypothetical protein